ncbi:MAG: oligosaccharide flippase family protein [Chthoniobacterales bacterium]|nr:oligosaccharide flippase family protein [Chthoniobacterales bacterium]
MPIKEKLAESPAGISSYGEILRSSSIMGGAQALIQILGLIRTKLVAVLLGPSGVGLVSLYVSLIGLVQSLAQMGLDQSGVREAAAAAARNSEELGKTAKLLRRACWITGLAGWALTACLARPLAQWTFESEERAWAVALLGSVVLLESIATAQRALLQGVRRLGDLAKMQVLGSLTTTIIAIFVYFLLGERGILPVIILTSAVQVAYSWHFARQIKVAQVPQAWSETLASCGQLVKLGLAFMYGGVAMSAVGFAIRAFISRDFGVEAAGVYQAAWALSGMFAGFVLQAMGTDFYPKLSGLSGNNGTVNRLVNEQIEVGLLLACPGIVGVIAFAPWVVDVLYSSKFGDSAPMLPWFALGVLGQVFSWPVGMIPAAKSATGYLYFSRTAAALLHAGLAFALIRAVGLQGSAIAFCAFVWMQNVVNTLVARKLSNFAYSGGAMRLLFVCLVSASAAWLIELQLSPPANIVSGVLLCAGSLTLSLKLLAARVPKVAAALALGRSWFRSS